MAQYIFLHQLKIWKHLRMNLIGTDACLKIFRSTAFMGHPTLDCFVAIYLEQHIYDCRRSYAAKAYCHNLVVV
jgi:hypothetical protein